MFFYGLTMGTFRGLLALLCLFLTEAQTQDRKNRFAGKFAENILISTKKKSLLSRVCAIVLHLK